MIKNQIESCGTRIKKALSLRGMTQAELCRLTKTPKSSLSEYIKGVCEPKEERLRAMARVLDVDPLWLAGYDVSMDGAKNASGERELDEGERLWMALYQRLDPEVRDRFARMVDKFDKLPEGERQMLLAVIGAAVKDQK